MTEEALLKEIALKIGIKTITKNEFEIFEFKKAEPGKLGLINIKAKNDSNYISGAFKINIPALFDPNADQNNGSID